MAFCWFSDLISLIHKTHTYTQRHTAHTGTNRLTHPFKYTLTPPLSCGHRSYLYYIEWKNFEISNLNNESGCFSISVLFLIVQKKQSMTATIFKLEIYHYTEISSFLTKYHMLTSSKWRRFQWMYLTFWGK